MKKILFLLLITITTRAVAQNNDYIVSMNGIGPIKIKMTIPELEKILNKKITLKNLLNKAEGYDDTIKTKYRNIDIQLYLENQYIDENKSEIILIGIKTSSPLCKTKSGIGLGDDKIKIINAYDDYTVYILPGYEDAGYTIKSKTKSSIIVSRDNNEITFYLYNKKVVAMEVGYSEGD